MGHNPGSKITSSRKQGAKRPPPPLAFVSRWRRRRVGDWPQGSKDHLRCPLLRVSEQQWELEPGLEGR